jgi:hypothetical protein
MDSETTSLYASASATREECSGASADDKNFLGNPNNVSERLLDGIDALIQVRKILVDSPSITSVPPFYLVINHLTNECNRLLEKLDGVEASELLRAFGKTEANETA